MNFNAEQVLSEFGKWLEERSAKIKAKMNNAEFDSATYNYWFNQGVAFYEVAKNLDSLKKQSAIEMLKEQIEECKSYTKRCCELGWYTNAFMSVGNLRKLEKQLKEMESDTN